MRLDLPRVRSLWLVAPLVLVALLTIATSARAEQYPPKPKGEDIAFLQLGAVGELVTLELFRAASHSDALGASEQHTFSLLANQTSEAWRGFNSLLGEGAISREVFAIHIPVSVLASRGKTLALAARFERLLTGLYLSGVQSTIDPPTRLLIGNHLLMSTQAMTVLRGMRGAKLNLTVPKQLSVEYVGEQFDHYLAIPSA